MNGTNPASCVSSAKTSKCVKMEAVDGKAGDEYEESLKGERQSWRQLAER